MTPPLLRAESITKHFPVTRGLFGKVVGQVQAVDAVSFDVAPGETLGLVGESGCGKTTVGRCVLRLTEPTSGRIFFDGADVTRASARELTLLRRKMQVVFQDPFSSLNPRMRVIDIVGEALEVHGLAKGSAVERRVAELLRRVGLSPSWINRYPHEFSGGQRQRIGIARAIALEPKLVVCDEAVSALDVSIQAQVLNLLIELRREMGLSYLFIAHDLSVVRHISHRIAVMYLGQIVELGTSEQLFRSPSHPYTRALLSAIPVPDPTRHKRRLVLAGDVPSPLNPPSGCRFHTRCPAVMERCRVEVPARIEVEHGHTVSCFHAEGLELGERFYEELSRRIEEHSRDHGKPAVALADLALPRARPEAREPPAEREAPPASRSRPVSRWWLVAPGLLLVTLGHPALGSLLALPTYVLLPRRHASMKRAADLLFALWLGVALLAGSAVSRFEQRRQAMNELSRLSSELTAFRKNTGAYPGDLADLGFRLFPIFAGGQAVDPWGRPFRYRAPGSDGRAFDLGSLGPDGIPDDDDIGNVPKKGSPP